MTLLHGADPSRDPVCVVAIAGAVPRDQYERIGASFPIVRLVDIGRGTDLGSAHDGAEVLLTAGLSPDELGAAVDHLPALRWIHSASSGADRLLTPRVVERDVTITRTASARATPMAEYVLTMLLALRRRLPELLLAQSEKRWQRLTAATLADSCVGIVGTGAVGRAVAVRARAFGARCIGIKRHPVPLPEFEEIWPPGRLHDLLRVADAVVLACPLTDETRHLVDAAALAAMKPDAIIVNVARGAVVVEQDLAEALASGRIAGAALDVFEHEPLAPFSPLWELPNVIITPHCSSAAPNVWTAVIDEFLSNLAKFLRGEPLANVIDVQGAGY